MCLKIICAEPSQKSTCATAQCCLGLKRKLTKVLMDTVVLRYYTDIYIYMVIISS